MIMPYDSFGEEGSTLIHVGTAEFVQVEVFIQAWTDETYLG